MKQYTKSHRISSRIAVGLFFLATHASIAATDTQNSDSITAPPLDAVGITILTVLLGGVTIAVLAAMIDRLHSICRQALDLVEISLRNSPTAEPKSSYQNVIQPSRTEQPASEAKPDFEPFPPLRSDDSGLKRRSFRVELARDLLPKIHDYITGFLAQHGREKEAGGMFVGEYLLNEATQEATFKIRGFIEAGPAADFSAGSILFDAEYQAGALRALQLEHPEADNIGCLHRHPGTLDVCSSGDLVTDREAVVDSGSKSLVFGIITFNNSRRLASSLFFRDFKIDFYLMADETGLEYEPILPTVVDLPLMEASPALTELQALRGAELGFDLAVLKQLPGLVDATLRKLDAAAGVLLTASFEELARPLQVWIQRGGALGVFYDDESGSRCELKGPWTQAELGGHVWLSHLLLKAHGVLTAARAPNYQRHFGILNDKYRLVAEVRAMKDLFGERAVLCRHGEVIFWKYTVRESGRSFPIEIRYPDGYPAVPPEIRSVKQLPPSPHRLGDHEPCWIDYMASDWNPARDTAAICVHAAHKWFACLLVYKTLGHWPAGADH